MRGEHHPGCLGYVLNLRNVEIDDKIVPIKQKQAPFIPSGFAFSNTSCWEEAMQLVVQKRLGIQASATRLSSDYFGVFSQVGLVTRGAGIEKGNKVRGI